MENTLLLFIIGATGLAVGFLITSTFLKKAVEKKSEHILKEATTQSEILRKDKILQAKEKFLQLKSEHEKIINEKNQNIQIRLFRGIC